MLKTTPFHDRVAAACETGLWSHWAGHLVVEKYQLAEKAEYYAVRNGVGIFDTSPLYKYRITGPDAEDFLAGVLARDIRTCRPGRAQYTMWCDDRGDVVEDGVVLRLSGDEFLLTAAGPHLAYLQDLLGRQAAEVEDVTDHYGAVAVQGPASGRILAALGDDIGSLPHFGVASTKLAGTPVVVSRTGYTGDLGYEVWVEAEDAPGVWDAIVEEGAPHGLIPFGQIALLMTRIEAGLLLVNQDFHPARHAWNDDQRDSPIELGYGWMLRKLADDDRPFVGRSAIERELRDGSSRRMVTGLLVDWRSWDRTHRGRGLIPPKDHLPSGGMMLYDADDAPAGHVTSFMYSPVMQRHIGIAKVRPGLAAPATPLRLEVTIDHRYEMVEATTTSLPFYDPPRKTARP